ncbi:MAG: DUF1156 domain-containing protein [Deltaproteobacteria bacterium]|nr:DUF1156 domain-containing protein [Deltaproteobacteria bacterium]
MSDDRPTMIEDYIPVERISYESAREKVARRRQGHLSTIHLWWARRPLAACRAAVYATFAAPATGAEREQLPGFFENLCHWIGPLLPDNEAIAQARAVVERAADGGRPRVLDMFAGGGAIPLEALRLGADAVAVELNPVAHLIELCTLVYPQKHGRMLRDAVASWGEWVIARTHEDLGDLYPDIPVEGGKPGTGYLFDRKKKPGGRFLRPIAYLWTRTIPSPARGYEKGMVPLVRQTWLRRKGGAYVALRPVVDRKNLTVRYEVVESCAKTDKAAIEQWGFDPAGQSVRGASTCPYSGNPVTAKEAKEAGVAGRMAAQLMAVACVEPGKRGKAYVGADLVLKLLPADTDLARRIAALCAETGLAVPDEQIEAGDSRAVFVQLYGLSSFGALFVPRQQLLLLTLCKHTRQAHDRIVAETGDRELAAAVAAYLALLVGRVADRGSTLCRWHVVGEKTEGTYARQALPMVWDFSEASPFGGASGDARMQLNLVLEVIDHAAAAAPGRPAQVIQGRAQKLPLEAESVDAVITDPPYYDSISYADLSDFFYVWHKRAMGPLLPAIFATSITPKKPEAVVAPHRHGGDKDAAARFYEEQMQKAFAEAHRVLRPGRPMVVVYAHKTTLGWSTLVDSLRRSGFQVTEAWPLSTEMPDRAGQMDTASLASSIFLVARKRPRGSVGGYATDVRPQMVSVVESRVRELMDLGISGADLVIAAVGAGLRPFTRHDRVELMSGEELGAGRFLDEVQREVLEHILARVFAVGRAGVGQVDKASRFYVLARYQYGLAPVEFGELNVLAQGLGIELGGPGSLSDGKHRLAAITKSQVRVLGFSDRGKEPALGLPETGTPAPLVDVLHRLLWLMEHDRAKLGPFLDDAKVDAGRLRLLAHALEGRALTAAQGGDRSAEQKAVDRLLAQWQRIVESRAVPLLEEGA